MGSSCAKYEDRLSAYMDGQLPPDEMAEMASHLEKCPVCSALLEKMRRLEEMADGVMPDFDDALMADLSARIAAGIEESGETAVTIPGRKAKVVPVWYRYVAVAASIAIVFFVGRMAFKDTGADLQRHQLPSSPQMMTPSRPVSPQPSLMDIPEVPTVEPEAKTPKKPESGSIPKPVVADEEVEGGKGASREKLTADAVVADDLLDEDARPQEAIIQSPAIVSQENEIPDLKLEKKGKDASETARRGDFAASEASNASVILGKITDLQTGEPLVGATVQLEGSARGAKTDFDGEFAIVAVPPDTYDLVYSAVGYKTRKIDAIPVRPDERIRADAQIEMIPHDAGRVTEVAGGREKDMFPAGKPASKKSLMTSSLASESSALTIDSLETLYEAATSGFASRGLIGFRPTDDAARPVETVDRYRALLDSVEASPKTGEIYRNLEVLYFKARASYDMYRETDDKKFLDMAGQYKNAMEEIIDRRLEVDEGNQTLLNYKAEIERWRF